MNTRSHDINLLKIALLPAFILTTVVLALSVTATTISSAVATDALTTSQTAAQPATVVAGNTADLGVRQGS